MVIQSRSRKKIEEGIKASGDIDVRSYDMVTADQAQVLEEIGFADGILFGTPTIVGEALKPIWDLTTSILREHMAGNWQVHSATTAGAEKVCLTSSSV